VTLTFILDVHVAKANALPYFFNMLKNFSMQQFIRSIFPICNKDHTQW